MNLTPEQMNEAVEAAGLVAVNAATRWEDGDDARPYSRVSALNRAWIEAVIAPAIEEVLPRLFAAWQEQTAAKAGEPPTRYDASGDCHVLEVEDGDLMLFEDAQAWAAAGVAASEARVRELREAINAYLDVDGSRGTFEALTLADARDALAALLSEEET